MGMMVVGADRSSFAIPRDAADNSEFFDTLYCLAPQDLDRLPIAAGYTDRDAVLAASAVLLAAAQEFVVVSLADLFPFWRQPVTDRVALAAIACAAVTLEHRSAGAGTHFPALDGALESIAALAERVSGVDWRPLLADYADRFDRALRVDGPGEMGRLFRCAITDLLIDPMHQRDHGLRIALLVRDASERFERDLLPEAWARLHCPEATNRDNIRGCPTNSRDHSRS